MVAADAAKRRVAPRQHKAAHLTARHMAEADAANMRAAPWQLQAAARITAWRMVEVRAAGRRTASS